MKLKNFETNYTISNLKIMQLCNFIMFNFKIFKILYSNLWPKIELIKINLIFEV